jgi:hypothetical protein
VAAFAVPTLECILVLVTGHAVRVVVMVKDRLSGRIIPVIVRLAVANLADLGRGRVKV